jgi:hypothetical protein
MKIYNFNDVSTYEVLIDTELRERSSGDSSTFRVL